MATRTFTPVGNSLLNGKTGGTEEDILTGEMEEEMSYFGNVFTSSQGEKTSEVFKDLDVVCLFFAAKSSPPCRIFTPVLKEFYNEVNMLGKVFEIILVSRDSQKEDFEEFLPLMPWVAYQFDDEKIMEFKKQFKISAIPTLVVLTDTGELVTMAGRDDVVLVGEDCFENWKKIALEKKEKALQEQIMEEEGEDGKEGTKEQTGEGTKEATGTTR